MRETDALFFNIESPAEGAVLPAGRQVLRGWLVPKPAHHFTDVRARVAGRLFPGVHGFPRPDLAAHFAPGRPWLLAEFSIAIDFVPGPAAIQLEALDFAGHWQSFAVMACEIAPASAPRPAAPAPLRAHEFSRALQLWLRSGGDRAEALGEEIPWPRSARDAHPPFHGYLDEPAAVSPAMYGRLHVLGWLFHEHQPLRRAFATADLLGLQPLELGGGFPGVRERFPGLPNAGGSRIFGFADAPAQSPSPLCVRVFGELADGSLHLCLAVRCRPTTTEELKASYPSRDLRRFRQGLRRLDSVLDARGVPREGGLAFTRQLWRTWRGYRAQDHPTIAAPLPPVPAPTPVAAAVPLSLLLVTHSLNYEGAPLFLFEYARHLAGRHGARLTVLSSRPGPLEAEFTALGARVIVGDADAFHRQSDRPDFALVVANTLDCHWAVPLAYAAGRPSLLYIHESTTPAVFFKDRPRELAAALAALAGASCVSFLTAATERYYPDPGGANHRINPGWIDLSRIAEHRRRQPREALRAALGLGADDRLIVNVGTVCDRKGQHVFARAVELLWRRDPALAARCRCVMVGGRDTPYNAFLRGFLVELGRPNLTLVAETAQAYDYYGAADLFVCSSYEESFPRVILEAMAFGLPIVSSSVHGIPEILRADRDAILVAPGDARALAEGIGRLLASPEAARRQGESARGRVESEFGLEQVLPRHAALASELAEIRR